MDKSSALMALSALSQASRLDAFRLLVGAGEVGIAAGEISARLGIVQNTMSAHLGILGAAGLVRHERDGRSIVYFADLPAMQALLSFLMEDCCGGRPDLCQPVIAGLGSTAQREKKCG
ncbi:MAG: helix-turn-helix transcriptional regulator [Hyphomicrobiaceae bacterium]|nr:helix-turn-helix transcriptional regulator [Hyphomicrobiaceae bacterium]